MQPTTRLKHCHRLVVAGLILMLALGSAGLQAELAISRGSAGSAAPVSSAQETADWTYTLKNGESFQEIADELLASSVPSTRLAHYNRFQSPSSLGAGAQIRIPVNWLKQQPEPARIRGVSGQVHLRRANGGNMRMLQEDDVIRAGDTVITRDGVATVELADGSQVQINPASSVMFNRLTRYGRSGMTDTRMRLERGGLTNRIKPMVEDGARFEITTPSAIAAVRGTRFSLQTDHTGSQLQVTEGEVSFGREGQTRNIPAGYGAAVSADPRAPIRIRQMPPAPTGLELPGTVTKLPQELSWPHNGAGQYQVNILDANTGHPVRQQRTSENRLALEGLANGEYRVEVAALTNGGTAGLPAETGLQVDLAARAAALLEPEAGATVDTDRPTFRWQYSGDNEQARVEIADDDSFTNLVASSDWSSGASARPNKPLRAGEYHWRVVTEAGGNSVATSTSRQLVINGTLPPINIISTNYVDRQVRIFWETLEQASGYLLQLSEDPSFNEVIKEATVEDSTAALRLIPGRRYFVRLRAVSDGSTKGRWGPGRELYVE